MYDECAGVVFRSFTIIRSPIELVGSNGAYWAPEMAPLSSLISIQRCCSGSIRIVNHRRRAWGVRKNRTFCNAIARYYAYIRGSRSINVKMRLPRRTPWRNALGG